MGFKKKQDTQVPFHTNQWMSRNIKPNLIGKCFHLEQLINNSIFKEVIFLFINLLSCNYQLLHGEKAYNQKEQMNS